MELVTPNEKYLETYYLACVETWGHVHDDYIIHDPGEYETWKNHIFEDFKNQEKGINLPNGFVPSITYWLVEEGEYIGTANIRLEINDALIEYGGTFGIFLKKSARGKSLGVKFARMVLQKVRELNISPIILTCEEDNIASWHVIEKLEYVNKELYTTIINGKPVQARRYHF